jgi:maltooligosyltrehalose trehalohydrolase
MHHLRVSTDDARRTLVMHRDEARVLVNLGSESSSFDLLKGEMLCLASRDDLTPDGKRIELPPMTLVLMMSTTEEVEDRQVQ